jgi:ubiquinone/menaquinone biosynthesis C-methylase UbiE
MIPITENFPRGNGCDEKIRRCYVERKLRQEFQQSTATTSECEQLLVYFDRLKSPGPGSRVLDLGCGTGRLTIPLAKSGYDVTGTDINGDVVNIARDKAKKENIFAHFTTSQAELLPFRNGVFDICIADSVLEHVKDWRKTIEEVGRILKPGGIAYFDAANALCPFPTEVKYIPFFGYIPKKIRSKITGLIVARCPSLVDYSPTPAQHWFTPTGLRKALFRAGFKQLWDLFDISTKDEIPPRYRFARPLLPLVKKIPHLYIRDITHLPLAAVRLFCRKG